MKPRGRPSLVPGSPRSGRWRCARKAHDGRSGLVGHSPCRALVEPCRLADEAGRSSLCGFDVSVRWAAAPVRWWPACGSPVGRGAIKLIASVALGLLVRAFDASAGDPLLTHSPDFGLVPIRDYRPMGSSRAARCGQGAGMLQPASSMRVVAGRDGAGVPGRRRVPRSKPVPGLWHRRSRADCWPISLLTRSLTSCANPASGANSIAYFARACGLPSGFCADYEPRS